MSTSLGIRTPSVPVGPAPDLAETQSGTVLLVDDEPTIARGYARILADVGFIVETASSGLEAEQLLGHRVFDVIVSDIAMPGMNGIELLRTIRQRDLDVPVIMMTGGPALESAIQAIEYGALRYLVKPVEACDLEQVVTRAVRLGQLARVRREVMEQRHREDALQFGARAGLEARFANALEGAWIAYQPIVSWAKRSLFAYEALVRCDEPTLRSPAELFDAAGRLGRVHDLGRIIRARVAASIPSLETGHVFVNVHPADLEDLSLFTPDSPLSAFAERVVLEITERAALDQIPDLMTRVSRLRAMGFRIAIDDLGAGYAGLTSFAQLEPDLVKVDMPLVRGVDRSPTKQKLLRSIIELCRDLQIPIIAEGIETELERDTLIQLGGDLCQGYLFAKPGKPFPLPNLD
jgi:EAL domain-containing protein (putative c-di-GMP-specific phosphodiesterase class I)/CheY-like chemotaxis protein